MHVLVRLVVFVITQVENDVEFRHLSWIFTWKQKRQLFVSSHINKNIQSSEQTARSFMFQRICKRFYSHGARGKNILTKNPTPNKKNPLHLSHIQFRPASSADHTDSCFIQKSPFLFFFFFSWQRNLVILPYQIGRPSVQRLPPDTEAWRKNLVAAHGGQHLVGHLVGRRVALVLLHPIEGSAAGRGGAQTHFFFRFFKYVPYYRMP